MTDTIKIPEVIYLQWYGDPNTDGGEVTWEREKMFDDDVKYVLAEDVDSADGIIIEIMRSVCKIQKAGKVVSIDFHYNAELENNMSYCQLIIFNDNGDFDAWLYDDVPPQFERFVRFSDENIVDLKELMNELMVMK